MGGFLGEGLQAGLEAGGKPRKIIERWNWKVRGEVLLSVKGRQKSSFPYPVSLESESGLQAFEGSTNKELRRYRGSKTPLLKSSKSHFTFGLTRRAALSIKIGDSPGGGGGGVGWGVGVGESWGGGGG